MEYHEQSVLSKINKDFPFFFALYSIINVYTCVYSSGLAIIHGHRESDELHIHGTRTLMRMTIAAIKIAIQMPNSRPRRKISCLGDNGSVTRMGPMGWHDGSFWFLPFSILAGIEFDFGHNAESENKPIDNEVMQCRCKIHYN